MLYKKKQPETTGEGEQETKQDRNKGERKQGGTQEENAQKKRKYITYY